jgi:hypothetical protein
MIPKSSLFGKNPSPDRRFVTHKVFATQFKDSLAKMRQDHTNTATATMEWQREYGNFAEAVSRYVEMEKTSQSPMVKPLEQVAGAFEEMVKAAPEQMMREVTAVADPLKEHVLYAESMKELLERQDYTQGKYESCRKETAGKQKSMEQLEKPEGISGFFRSLSTPNKAAEQAKMQQLTKELEACKLAEEEQEQATVTFNKTALGELEEFGVIKSADIKSILIQYAKLQQEYCRKNLATWSRIKDACSDERETLPAE